MQGTLKTAMRSEEPELTSADSRVANITINGRQYAIRHAASEDIGYLIDEVFVVKQYPALPFLPSPVQLIVDVGANIGCSSIWFHSQYPGATILAVEPGRRTFDFLKANIAALGCVRPFNFGLCDRDSSARLYHGNNNSRTSSIGRSGHNTDDYEEVQVRRASLFFAEQRVDRISILKLDTEGAEVPILRDVEHLLDRIDAIYLEYHSEADRREIDHLLSGHFALHTGRIQVVHRGSLVYVAKDVIRQRTNLDWRAIARPRI